MGLGERQSIENRIATLLSKGGALTDDEFKAEIAKYLCILSCGFLEASCREILQTYVDSRAERHVAAFVATQLEKFQNPKVERILQLVGAFGKAKREAVENSIDDEHKDAVNSIVANRHNLAHGRNVGISLGRLREYYEKARILLTKVKIAFQ